MNQEQILQDIQMQKEYLQFSEFKNYKNRIKYLKLLYKNIKELEQEILEALKQDLNKSFTEGYMSEVGLVLDEISYMVKHCKKFSKIKKVKTPLSHFPAKSYKIPCAYGQVLIISPWNYPFMLSLSPLVDAISAGNSIVLKSSETSSHVSAVIEKLITKTFKKELVLFVRGGRNECSFLLDQDFDYIFFTGSTRVGKIVMQKASEHFTPVTLEMGGKSPCIVDETASIELTAKRIVFGKLLNCGQTCVAPDYIYCHTSIKDKLIEALKKQIEIQYSKDPINNPNYPKMINEKQFNAMLELIDDKKVIYGGKSNKELLKIEPTIIDADFSDKIMQEEIFGPLMPIVTFDKLDEAISYVNSKNKPLALYFFSNDKSNQQKVISCCDFGGGCINDTIMHIANNHLGFGGLKQSGVGAYHGKVGFDTFTHYKSVLNKKNWLDMPIRYQPFSKTKDSLIRKFLK